MRQKVLNPVEAVASLILQGIELGKAITIVTREADQLGVPHTIPSADEVRSYIWRHRSLLDEAVRHAQLGGSVGPIRIAPLPPSSRPSPVVVIGTAVLEAYHHVN